jgi:hypothetical protein
VSSEPYTESTNGYFDTFTVGFSIVFYAYNNFDSLWYQASPETETKVTEIAEEKTPTLEGIVTQPTSIKVTNSPEPTMTPTWTPLPTLESKTSVIDSLMQDNAGCRLPCWWGITPGETSWDEARHFLESFTSIESAEYNFGEENSQSYIDFFVNPGPGERFITAFFNIQGGVVQIIRIGKEATQYSFLLHQLLTGYGKPDAILLGSHAGIYQYQAYSLVLVYYEQRILAEFFLEVDTAIQPLEICITTSPSLLVWSDELIRTEEQVLANIPDYLQDDPPPPPIEETTDIDSQTFYQQFRLPDVAPCLEIK